MSKISSLTPWQKSQIPIWHDRWMKIGTAEGPSNKAILMPAIKQAYAIIGREIPFVWWVESPLSAQLVFHVYPSLRTSLFLKGRPSSQSLGGPTPVKK